MEWSTKQHTVLQILQFLLSWCKKMQLSSVLCCPSYITDGSYIVHAVPLAYKTQRAVHIIWAVPVSYNGVSWGVQILTQSSILFLGHNNNNGKKNRLHCLLSNMLPDRQKTRRIKNYVTTNNTSILHTTSPTSLLYTDHLFINAFLIMRGEFLNTGAWERANS